MSLRLAPTAGSPLRYRNYRWLVAGTTINSFGSALTPVALAFAVLDLGGSATQLGVVVGAFALAEALTTLFGGALGDRVSRRLLMEVSNAASAVVQVVVAALLISHRASIGMLVVAEVVVGVASALAGPSSSAMTPLTVPDAVLPAAVSLRRLGQNVAQIIGFGAAGIIVAVLGSAPAIAVDGLTFLLAAACFSRLRMPPSRQAAHDSMFRDIGVGAREVMRHTWLWVLIGQALLYHLMYGGVQGVLGPIIIGDAYGRAAWGGALAALMVGFVVGGLLTLRWRPRRALAVGVTALSLTAAFPLSMAWSGSVGVVFAGAFLHGLGLEIFSVWWDVSIQQQVAPDRLARVYSFDIVGSFVMRPLGLVLAGPVAQAVGFRPWLLVVGAVMGGSSLLALTVPGIRRLERRSPG